MVYQLIKICIFHSKPAIDSKTKKFGIAKSKVGGESGEIYVSFKVESELSRSIGMLTELGDSLFAFRLQRNFFDGSTGQRR